MDWLDEEMGDAVLLYKSVPRTATADPPAGAHLPCRKRPRACLRCLRSQRRHEPRTGPVADGTRVRKDDRLAFTGRVVYEGSDIAAPRPGILADVFDGERRGPTVP